MYFVSTLLKETIPNYLIALPIPDSVGGWFRLGARDWLTLLPPTVAVAGVSYLSYQIAKGASSTKKRRVNPGIQKNFDKVVNFIDIEDITKDELMLCRCWKSKTWPYCNGFHNAHNLLTGDNIGPMVVKCKQKK